MKNNFGRISVIGLGYIGLPTAVVLASRGVDVIGVDVNPQVVDAINRGGGHIVEPELGVMVRDAVSAGRLRAVITPEPAEAFIIAVPTPMDERHGPDITYVEKAARSIAPALQKGNLVILESTSPVGTTEKVAAWLAEERPDLSFPQQKAAGADVKIAYAPERVLPGHILRELTENDRIIGGMSPDSAEMAQGLYRIFVTGQVVLTDTRTAEMVKLTENAFRDVNIAFANEVALICEEININPWELISLANLHPRVKILQPGPGVGGHCIAVDPWFIVSSAPDAAKLIRTARNVNDGKPRHVAAKVREAAAKLRSPVIACLGLSYKANVDDMRESPAVLIVKELAESKAGRIMAVEPNSDELPHELNGLPVEMADLETALTTADILVLLVDHREFVEVPHNRLAGKVVIDTRGIWTPRNPAVR